METVNLQHGHQRQSSQPQLPASPTLTNPDLILPDYDRGDSLDLDDGRSHSPLTMWKNAHAASSGDLHQIFAISTPGQQRIEPPYGPTAPITPTTPIIYGNGTMLSDIGEVTEAESTPGKPSPTRTRGGAWRRDSPSRDMVEDTVMGRLSPTPPAGASMKKRSRQSMKKERRSSTDSTSTITTQEHTNMFADFDDSVSVIDSVFQADDEESMASSYADDNPKRDTMLLDIPNTDNSDRVSIYSTTSLSRRAEEILDNAKKRLTTMEGNLSRARTTLHSPDSLGSEGMLPSPPFERAQTALYQRDSTPASPISPGHARQSSDVAFRDGLPYRVSQRSQSALGAAGGYRQPKGRSDVTEPEADRSIDRSTSSRGQMDNGLAPLREDEQDSATSPDATRNSAILLDQFHSPTFGGFRAEHNGGRGMQRPASAAQVRDLRDQMRGLKGKISNLREQARADSMKRRSLQSLRTPSPFTHAKVSQWYTETESGRHSAVSPTSQEPSPRDRWNGEAESVDGVEVATEPKDSTEEEVSVYSEVDTKTGLRPAESHAIERKADAATTAGVDAPVPDAQELPADDAEDSDDDDHFSDMLTENGDHDDAAPEEQLPLGFHEVQDLGYGYESESGESMYHDTLQHPVSHEDREDAFDYEHFFLHSAMGTMSQQRLAGRGRSDSYSSDDSVETTRGPILDGAEQRASWARSRRNSDASVSTVETFATADEGRSSKFGSRSARASFENHRDQTNERSDRTRVASPESAKRLSCGSIASKLKSGPVSALSRSKEAGKNSDGSISPIAEEGKLSEDEVADASSRRPMSSTFRRPMSSSAAHATMRHRPSTSSFDSTGTNRSFPLVNKMSRANSTTGVLTPNASPDAELKSISETLLKETASSYDLQAQNAEARGHTKTGSTSSVVSARFTSQPNAPQAMQALLREDQFLVERLVSSLGRCVLGLTESGRASSESRMYRRRLEAARRVLEGMDEDVSEPI